ncbi:palmitoyltransferase ZDHHC18 isoform X1 [Arapaima gigas]
MCTESTKDFLEMAVHSPIISGPCLPGTLKTAPTSLIVTSSNTSKSHPLATGSLPSGREERQVRRPSDKAWSHRAGKWVTRHTAAPTYVFSAPGLPSHRPLVIRDVPNVGFISLH